MLRQLAATRGTLGKLEARPLGWYLARWQTWSAWNCAGDDEKGKSSVPKYINFTVYCYKQGMTCSACWQTSRGRVANAPSWGRATHNKLLPQGPTFSIPFVRVHWAELIVWRGSSCTIKKPTFICDMQEKNKHFYPHCNSMLLADPFLLLGVISWGCFWGKSDINSNWRSKTLSTYAI